MARNMAPAGATHGHGSHRRVRLPDLLALLALCLSSSMPFASGKVVHGEAQLGSVNTERYLTKFSATKGAELRLRATFDVGAGFWDKKHSVELDVFTEAGFGTFKQKLDRGSLCDDRVKHAYKREVVAPRLRSAGRRSDPVEVNLDWTNDQKSQIFYLYVTDCALEWYNAKGLPPLMYDLEIVTEQHGHLPSDEWGLLTFNLLTSIVLGALFFVLLGKSADAYRKQKQIHAFVLVVVAAYALQLLSLVCETLHLVVYNYNGKGLRWRHTFFALDFVSEVSQGASEHLVSLLLIFLACGWTTVSLNEVVRQVTDAAAKAPAPGSRGGELGIVELAARSARRLLRNPKARQLARQLASPARSIFRQVSLGGVFVVVLTALHLLLEMMGRRYHDEFSQFHDHEHWPGKCILALRVMLWVIFLGGALMTHNGCKKGSELRSSMVSLAAFGTVWLLAFPVTVVVAGALPPRLRHRFVSIGSVLLQMVALQYLSYLCFFSTKFAKVSSISDPRKAETLPSEGLQRGKPGASRRRLKVAYD